MNRSIRGAATVGIAWVVALVVIVVFLAGGLWLVASEKTDLEAQRRAAVEAEAVAKTKFEAATRKLADLSTQVGYRDESDHLATSRPDEVSGKLKSLRETHAAVFGSDVTTLSRAIDQALARIDELDRLLGEAKQAADTAEKSRASLQQNLQDVTRQKDEAIAAVEKQLSDERDRNASQESADKTRIDELNRRLDDAAARAKSEKEDLEKQIAGLETELRTREGRIAELAKKVEVIKLPDEPDGSVVAVSNAGTCYIDLGTRDLLRRGTRFKVFTFGKGGVMREKGMIEVSSVEESMAEATVVQVNDRFDPIARGDVISAPNYDPEMPREFVLVGRFPTGYSRGMVADRLRALGAKVADRVGPSTDFLVLGDRETVAAADGAEGEESPEDAADSEELKLANQFRVQILPVREILEYLKYE